MGIYDDIITGNEPVVEQPPVIPPPRRMTYEEIVHGITRTPPRAAPVENQPEPPRNIYGEIITGVEPRPVSREGQPGQPFGELKPADVSPTQRAKWALMSGLEKIGVQPQYVRHLAEAGVGLGQMAHPLTGASAAAADAGWNVTHGNYGTAALNALGVIPGVSYARQLARGAPMVRTAEPPVLRGSGDYEAGRSVLLPNLGRPMGIPGMREGGGVAGRRATEAAEAAAGANMQPRNMPPEVVNIPPTIPPVPDRVTLALDATGRALTKGGGYTGGLIGASAAHYMGADPIGTAIAGGAGYAAGKAAGALPGRAFQHMAADRMQGPAIDAATAAAMSSHAGRMRGASGRSPPVVDPRVQARDMIALALMPTARKEAADYWGSISPWAPYQ